MGIAEAKKILEKPVFGDPTCIAAVKVLEQESEAEGLRKKLKGKESECLCCDGSGDIDCRAGCVHKCPTCYGTRTELFTESRLKKMDLGNLRSAMEQVGEAVS